MRKNEYLCVRKIKIKYKERSINWERVEFLGWSEKKKGFLITLYEDIMGLGEFAKLKNPNSTGIRTRDLDTQMERLERS